MIERIAVLAFVLAIPLGFCGLVYLAVRDDGKWAEFRDAHNCKITQKVDSTVGTGFTTTIGPNGKVGFGPTTVFVPDKTAWLCDDGVTYWR